MAFTLDPRERLEREVRRVARSQIAKLTRVLEDPEGPGVPEAVHEARKRCKKLRGLTRLVRPGLGDLYTPSNEAFRDAARQLAPARDAHVLVETLDALLAAVPEGVEAPDVTAARSELLAARARTYRSLGAPSTEFRTARQLIREGANLVGRWELDDDFEPLQGGIAKTYRRFRNAFSRCGDEPTTEAFHEWRKRAKYHRYHLELLRAVYPSMMEPWVDEMHRLTDALGDDHDLAVLTGRVRSEPELFGSEDMADAILVLAEGRGSVLRDHAMALGARLAAEESDSLTARFRGWWEINRSGAAEPERTSLADFT